MNKKGFFTLGLLFLLLAGCQTNEAPSKETLTDDPTTTPIQENEQKNASIPSLEWEAINLSQITGLKVQHVTNILVTKEGDILASFYDENSLNGIAHYDSEEEVWGWNALPREIKNARVLRERSDGTFLLGTTSEKNTPIFWESHDGNEWTAIETEGEVLPNLSSINVWDILELKDGRILIATDNADNDPDRSNPTLYALEENRLSLVGSFPGIGILAIEQDREGVIYVATEESDEHDDPELAGQAHIFKSLDGGENWEEADIPEGANRVYDILAASDGTVYLGSGIRGEFFRSKDQGETWETMTHVPTTEKLWGNPPVPTPMEASRVYKILELSNGMILVGTGNTTGSIFLTDDGGETWVTTGDTGSNIVTWGIAEDPLTKTVWAGTGSRGGDILWAEW